MKIKELKHNHSLTDLLKVILFSIVMLLPFFSVLTRSLYVICNKNAYQSYYGETINEFELSEVDTNLIANETYYFLNDNQFVGNTNTYEFVYYTDLKSSLTEFETLAKQGNRFRVASTNLQIYSDTGFVVNYSLVSGTQVKNFTFVSMQNVSLPTEYENTIYNITYNQYSYLDNAFEYSLNELENNNLFSWTKNTGTYTAINAMCTGLEMEMPVIPVILTYWFLISVIYLVLDIVIKTITYITHIIGSRA